MLTKTTLSAIRELIHLASTPDGKPLSPRSIAKRLDLSPTYTAKVTAQLARSGILQTHRGAQGGVTLARQPESITLLEIFEACQGRVVGDYCKSGVPAPQTCSFHRMAAELHQAIVEVLSGYSLADLMVRPVPICKLRPGQFCLIAGPPNGGVLPGMEKE